MKLGSQIFRNIRTCITSLSWDLKIFKLSFSTMACYEHQFCQSIQLHKTWISTETFKMICEFIVCCPQTQQIKIGSITIWIFMQCHKGEAQCLFSDPSIILRMHQKAPISTLISEDFPSWQRPTTSSHLKLWIHHCMNMFLVRVETVNLMKSLLLLAVIIYQVYRRNY